MVLAITPVLKIIGDIGQYALPIGVGLQALYKGYINEGIALGASAGIQQIVLNALKKTIVAPRPYPNHLRFDSFPSGHTAGAFLAVGFIFAFDLINSKKSNSPCLSTAYKVGIVALALIVGISRYLCQMHWPIDIAAGSLVGLFFGAAAVLIPHTSTAPTLTSQSVRPNQGSIALISWSTRPLGDESIFSTAISLSILPL